MVRVIISKASTERGGNRVGMSLHHRGRVASRHVHVHVHVLVVALKKVEGVGVVKHDDDVQNV